MERNVPELRFKEFNDEWKKRKLNSFIEKITEKNRNYKVNNVISNSAKNGLISQNDYFDKDIANQSNIDGYYIIRKNDFVYNPRKSVEAPYGPINKYKYIDEGVVSPLYLCFRIHDSNVLNNYLEYYFKSPKWHRYIYINGDQGARHDRVSIKDSDFMNMGIKIPSMQEQERIANFLTKVDKIIEKQYEKVKNLEKYKKGMMQKIFSQEIRFKDENGKEYPEWEEYKLNELCNFFSGGTPLTSKKEYYDGNIPFIRSAEISSENTELTISEIGLNNSSAKMIQKGDLLYALYGATSGEVSISKLNGAINQAILCIRSNRCNLIFLEKVLRNSKQNIIKTYLQGGQGNLSANIIKELQYNFPCLDEQDKISKFITKIDIILQKEIDKLNGLYKWKKGLLQQMFV